MRKSTGFIFGYLTLNFFLYFSILSSLIFIEIEQKNQIASVSTQLVRENFLFTDFRTVKKDLAKITGENFSAVEAFDNTGAKIINFSNEKTPFTIKIKKYIWSDSQHLHHKGTINYYFEIANLFRIALKPFLISLLFSLPLFLFFVRYTRNRETEKIEHEKSKALNKISLQISHDIRSPIATLHQILQGSDNMNASDKKLFHEALLRIDNIADSHLKTRQKGIYEEKKNFNLRDLIEQISCEKNIEFKDLTIEIKMDNILIECSYFDLARIISNLINNSYEAMISNKKICISAFQKSDETYLYIEDFGHGIPPAIMQSIGKKEITNKKNGNGLGLMHAIEVLKSWNSRLEIIKTNDSGTIIEIVFPSTPSKNFLLDNDELVCLTWTTRAQRKNIKLEYSLEPNDFWEKIKEATQDSNFYIDSDLGGELKGEVIAQKLYNLGFKNIYLTTGYAKENFNHMPFIKTVMSKAPPF